MRKSLDQRVLEIEESLEMAWTSTVKRVDETVVLKHMYGKDRQYCDCVRKLGIYRSG